MGLKTHSKLALVVRDEPEAMRRYAHIGTGNYNPKTARLYEDLGLLTADTHITADISHLFNNLSGFGRTADYSSLLVAPDTVRTGIIARILEEIRHHHAGRPAAIRIKVNSLVDEAVIDALYRASQAGVPVDLWVRGICAMRPWVSGLSETVRVRSVLGRFLEHSRIFWFENGGSPEAWIGSADLMHRNLDRRVEVLARIPTAAHVEELGHLLDLGLSDQTASWHLDSDGTWTRHHLDADGRPLRDLHAELMDAKRRRRAAATVGAATRH
jgi:polyphosphate kinase